MAAAASSNARAMPRRRCDRETKMREMPMGVGSGVGEQQRLVVVSTITGVG